MHAHTQVDAQRRPDLRASQVACVVEQAKRLDCAWLHEGVVPLQLWKALEEREQSRLQTLDIQHVRDEPQVDLVTRGARPVRTTAIHRAE